VIIYKARLHDRVIRFVIAGYDCKYAAYY